MKSRPKSFFINKLLGVCFMVTQCYSRLDFKVDVETFIQCCAFKLFSTVDSFVEIENVFVYLTPQKTYHLFFVFRTYILS